MADGWSNYRNDCKLININKVYFAEEIMITSDSHGVHFFTQKIVQKANVAYMTQPVNSYPQQALAQVQVGDDIAVSEQAYAEGMTIIANQTDSPPLAEAMIIPSHPFLEVPVTHVKAGIKEEI